MPTRNKQIELVSVESYGIRIGIGRTHFKLKFKAAPHTVKTHSIFKVRLKNRDVLILATTPQSSESVANITKEPLYVADFRLLNSDVSEYISRDRLTEGLIIELFAVELTENSDIYG